MNTDVTKTEKKPAGDRFEDLWEAKEIAREQRAIEANTKINTDLESQRHEHALAEHRAANDLAAQRDVDNFDRHAAFNDARDRRVLWVTAVGGALANPNCPDATTACDAADAALAEYEKRWPDVGV